MDATKSDKRGKRRPRSEKGPDVQLGQLSDSSTARGLAPADGAVADVALACQPVGTIIAVENFDNHSGTHATEVARQTRVPLSVKSREVASRIRRLADQSESLDTRRRLRQLAEQITHGSHNVQGIAFIEASLGECLDEAGLATQPREQWLSCEAATWGLAWLARTRRAGGSAGGLLQRLVKMAQSMQAILRGNDTGPAAFILALSRLFCDIEACQCLERDVTHSLEEEVGRLVSAGGAVSLAASSATGCLTTGSAAVIQRVSRWTVVREIAMQTGNSLPWNAATEERWSAACEMALHLLGNGGRILAASGKLPKALSQPLLDAARASDKKPLRRTAEAIGKLTVPKSSVPAKKLLPRDLHDPTAAVTIVRTGWSYDSLRVSLEYRDATPRLEIAAGDRLLMDGLWHWQVLLNGRSLDAEGPWSVSCFESDRKASFLEIIAPLAEGLQIERQVVIIPKDRIVLLADAITVRPGGTCAEHGALEYEGTTPLATSLATEAAAETREIIVYDTAMRFTAMPIALPEWSSAAARGTCDPTPQGIRLRQQSTGSRLYAPLWLDCDASRLGSPLTWRQLTVADTRMNLARHEAVGFRVQAGLKQWLLYRALDKPRNRTLLGCNLSCEFLLGRIGRRGSVSRTLEIQ
ncbi:MAG: hypothetical protein WCQ91_01260 [Planctomycetota bacterium]